MCCCLSGEPVEDSNGKIRTFETSTKFQTGMCGAPCAGGLSTCCWFCGQFVPITCGCTQFCLRRKVLEYDMSKYSCFQGYFDFCCFRAGSCGEDSCPELCLACESCCCNFAAVSASRIYVMEKYDLSSDPCDYRLIRINNCLQCLACICNVLAIFIDSLRECAHIINCIANLFYHCVSGCMTAQVAHEVDYQNSIANPTLNTPVIAGQPVDEYK